MTISGTNTDATARTDRVLQGSRVSRQPQGESRSPLDASPSVLLGGSEFPPRTLWDVFVSSAERWPSSLALDDGARRLTYSELRSEAERVAAQLANAGIGRGDRIGILVPSGTAGLYVAILGALRAGAAYVPVDVADPSARRDLVWNESDVAAVISADLQIDVLHAGSGLSGPPTPADDCWVIFTSGSTGVPKGVVVTHRSAAAFVDAETLLWKVDPTDRVQAALSVGFDASCEEMWLAWRNGAALVATPRSVMLLPEGAATWIHERRITVVSTVPTLAALWPADLFEHLHLLILGGEACSESLAEHIAGRTEVWNTYGPTEATVVTTACRLGGGRPTIGNPLAGWKVAVVDGEGQVVPEGEDGELVIGGVGLARYLDPAIDATKFKPLPALEWDRAYHTGDRVRLNPGGLDFVGRVDDQVKINGRRVELGEVDAALAALPGVEAAASAVRETMAGNRVLIGYLVGAIDLDEARRQLVEKLPGGLVPLLVVVEEIPRSTSGKLNRSALPWPLPVDARGLDQFGELGSWLGSLIREHLGPVSVSVDTDFFGIGGNSLAAAKFVSAVRTRFPTVGVADLYARPVLGDFATWLSQRVPVAPTPTEVYVHRRRFRWIQLLGVGGQFLLVSPRWIAPLLIFNKLANRTWAPSLPLVYVILAWFLVASLPGRLATMAGLKRLLLGGLEPGRYPRGGRVHLSIWLLERVAETCDLDVMCNTPWVRRYARAMGAEIDADVTLASEPPVLGMLEARSGSSIEADVEIVNWYFDGDQIVVGPVSIGRDVRVGARSCLMPGTVIEDHAEIEAGSCITGQVESGERWAGSPAQYVGEAGEGWPSEAAPSVSRTRTRLWDILYALSAQALTLVPLLPAVPALLLILEIDQANTLAQSFRLALLWAPLLAVSFLVGYSLLAVALIRFFGVWVRPGIFPSHSWNNYFGWLSGRLVDSNLDLLSSVYSSLATPLWLRLLGSRVGKNAEIATPVGVPSLFSVGAGAFIADDVFFAQASSWRGWLRVGRVDLGERAFVGNSALLDAGTAIDEDALIAVMSRAPTTVAARTSWLGSPSVEFPRAKQVGPQEKTFQPRMRLKVERGAVELFRAILPVTLTFVITMCVLTSLDWTGTNYGVFVMILACPIVLGAAALTAWAVTVLAKWLVCGRYRAGLHPLWSNYVWRTEFVNAMHEDVAGTWFTPFVIGTEIFNIYLRSMGSKIGNDVWCETWSITEFDLVELGDGVTVSKDCDVQTHLFHDRMMRVGAVKIGAGSIVGTNSVILPEAELEEHVTIGAKSLVMRGELLAAGTSWQGTPIVAV